jgi:hypothetical protein
MRTHLVSKFSNVLNVETLLDITDTLYSLPEECLPSYHELRDALSTGQIESKLWVLQEFKHVLTAPKPYKVLVVGGWLGILPRLLFNHFGYSMGHITSIDIDPRCEEIARKINLPYTNVGRFSAETADMVGYDYSNYDIVINTSCEHLSNVNRWIKSLPIGTKIVAQSNNAKHISDHVSCVYSLTEFVNQLQLSEIEFQSQLDLVMYTRYMVIGQV